MDNTLIKKVMTFKSGNFVFSTKYDASEVNNLLFKARLLYTTIVDLPILPEWSVYLEEELIRRSIFSTAALEGNPLKEEEVGKIIEQADDGQKNGEAKKAILNLKKVYGFIKKIDPIKGFALTEDFIRESHRIITDGLDYTDNLPGKYRNHIVKVGNKEHGGVYTPPKCQPDIVNLMKEFVEWINCKEMMESDGLIRAALAHYHLGLIHPFGNGNGRTIRIVEAMLLRTSGIKYVPTMLSNYYYRKIDDYYFAFSLTQKNPEHDVTIFVKFMLEGVIDSLNEIKDNITFRIRELVMRDYCTFLKNKKVITQRQHDLLCILLESGKTISLKNLFNVSPYNALYRNVSERTARRDMSKLLKLNILLQENGDYRLNLRALG
ncbi:MAG TPA: Fic family protein [Syntrophales bacterium]|nr:Fic family protein [Syntrophales bacterium]